MGIMGVSGTNEPASPLPLGAFFYLLMTHDTSYIYCPLHRKLAERANYVIHNSMPITKSAKKALRQNKKRRLLNLRYKRKFKALIKEFRKTVAAKDIKKAEQILYSVYKAVDKAAKHGTIKKNTASRYKSRLSKSLHQKQK